MDKEMHKMSICELASNDCVLILVQLRIIIPLMAHVHP